MTYDYYMTVARLKKLIKDFLRPARHRNRSRHRRSYQSTTQKGTEVTKPYTTKPNMTSKPKDTITESKNKYLNLDFIAMYVFGLETEWA